MKHAKLFRMRISRKKRIPPAGDDLRALGEPRGSTGGAPGELWESSWGLPGEPGGAPGEPRGSRGSPSRFKSDCVKQSGALKSDHAVVIALKTC